MTNSTNTATIHFAPGVIDSVVDQLSSFLDAQDFPVLHADIEAGTITVNSASDHNDYSVLMAAGVAAERADLDAEDVLQADLS